MEPKTEMGWKRKTYLLGGLLGALTGLGVAYFLIRRAEAESTRVEIGAGEGVRLGLLVLGLLRQVSELGRR